MTTAELPAGRPARLRVVVGALQTALIAVISVVGSATRPSLRHIEEHAYSIAGLGFIDAAAFTHSRFTGLLVTGITFLLFEWKVSDD